MYNQAFDLYHAIFRMIHMINRFQDNEILEIDRIRIWDFYLLFPYKVHQIRLNNNYADCIKYRKEFIKKEANLYDYVYDGRKFLERLQPYQLAALNCLASYGIIDTEALLNDKIKINDKKKLMNICSSIGGLSIEEKNTLSWLCLFFKTMPMNGTDGLKSRTKLLISKYDGN